MRDFEPGDLVRLKGQDGILMEVGIVAALVRLEDGTVEACFIRELVSREYQSLSSARRASQGRVSEWINGKREVL
jgi:hypothetical protein